MSDDQATGPIAVEALEARIEALEGALARAGEAIESLLLHAQASSANHEINRLSLLTLARILSMAGTLSPDQIAIAQQAIEGSVDENTRQLGAAAMEALAKWGPPQDD